MFYNVESLQEFRDKESFPNIGLYQHRQDWYITS